MPFVDIQDAQHKLAELMDALESGHETEIIISRNGKPVARLLAATADGDTSKRLGIVEGKYADFTLEEFNAMDDEIARLFYGEDIEPQKKVAGE